MLVLKLMLLNELAKLGISLVEDKRVIGYCVNITSYNFSNPKEFCSDIVKELKDRNYLKDTVRVSFNNRNNTATFSN